MKRRLSSLQTFFFKVVVPAICLVGWGIGISDEHFKEENAYSLWLTILVMLMVTTLIFWSCIRLKTVAVDGRFLYVTNYTKEIAIPFSEIADVTENRWVQGRPVTIHLKSPSAFGDKIVFMPKTGYFLLWDSHPVVSDLKRLAGIRHAKRRRR